MATTWIAPAAERRDPDLASNERESLEQWLDYERATLLTKCAGLTAEQLKTRAVPPSALSLLGLVRHMVEVERWWFRMHAGGQTPGFEYCADANDSSDFDDVADADAAADLQTFHAEVRAARAAVAGKPLDDVFASLGHHPERTRNLRWVFVHMIEEYARHNGHADLIRECLDGVTGE